MKVLDENGNYIIVDPFNLRDYNISVRQYEDDNTDYSKNDTTLIDYSKTKRENEKQFEIENGGKNNNYEKNTKNE